METVNAVGRRKAAVARVIVSDGTGAITINKRPLEVYFPSSILQYIVKQPLLLLDVPENTTSTLTLTVVATRVRPRLSVSLLPALLLKSMLTTSIHSVPQAS